MVDETNPLDRSSSADRLSGHAGDHSSSRGQKISDVAFWGN